MAARRKAGPRIRRVVTSTAEASCALLGQQAHTSVPFAVAAARAPHGQQSVLSQNDHHEGLQWRIVLIGVPSHLVCIVFP